VVNATRQFLFADVYHQALIFELIPPKDNSSLGSSLQYLYHLLLNGLPFLGPFMANTTHFLHCYRHWHSRSFSHRSFEPQCTHDSNKPGTISAFSHIHSIPSIALIDIQCLEPCLFAHLSTLRPEYTAQLWVLRFSGLLDFPLGIGHSAPHHTFSSCTVISESEHPATGHTLATCSFLLHICVSILFIHVNNIEIQGSRFNSTLSYIQAVVA
jgi:hypothetical protein